MDFAGSMIGSPLYILPEQARGYRNIDGRSDLWSLGVVATDLAARVSPREVGAYPRSR